MDDKPVHECVGFWTDDGKWQAFPGEPIVRCKECVFGKAVEQIGCIRFADRGSDGLKDPDGFCAWGEVDDAF